MLDLLVVGGGPVGLATALYARRAGLEVEVLEPRAGVVDKACGEGLMPSAVAALLELGVDPVGYPLRGIRYLAGGRTATADFGAGRGRGVRRTVLHAALRQALADAGVAVRSHRVAVVEQDDAGVALDGLRARYVVAADGLHSPLRRLLDLQARGHGPVRYGLRCHVATEPWGEHVEVHWAAGAEAYVTPVDHDLVGIAVLTDRRGPFSDHLAQFPDLAEKVAAGRCTPVRGAGPLRQRTRRRVAGRVLLVGDASGYVDALTGEGIALGLRHARAAVAAVVADRPQRYERDWRRLTAPHAGMTHVLLQATRVPALRRALVPAASRLPRVFSAAVDRLAG